ncbi:hypothetical protein T459_06224 [Capsicum annuum]|uniref:Pectinesterase n=1 Tax=Capsicum annuum TaxID=4072 RepID=A0A2G3AA85_CAPAN|nr:hypothetical protein T459_06224 [Capsicum annuum]
MRKKLLNSHKFIRECNVSGTVDFISGSGRVIFQNSFVKARSPMEGQGIRILAPGADQNTPNPGLVLQNCELFPVSGFNRTEFSGVLGWPWKNQGKGVSLSSYISGFIDPQGWAPHLEVTDIYMAEYNNRGPGLDTKDRVKWSKVIDKEETFKFTVYNFLQGDKWISKIISHYLDHLDDSEDSA